MDRITGNTQDLGGGRRGFRGRNVALGQSGTIPGEVWFNDIQEEVLGPIEGLGLVATAGNRAQLLQALRRAAALNIRTITATTTLTADDAGLVLVSAAGGAVTLTLPAVNAAGGAPLRFDILRSDGSANTLTVQRAGSDTIEGATAIAVPPGGRLGLVGDGSSSWRQDGGAGRLLGIQRFTANGTYTPTPGTRFIIVTGVGGGGGGAGSAATVFNGTSIGGCGSGGAGGRGLFTTGFAGAAVTIGAGGAGGGVGGAGGNGGTTSLGALISFPGGVGGSASAASSSPLAGGNGNTPGPTGANLYAHPGGSGGMSQALDGSSSYGAFGGTSIFGPGAAARSVNVNGAPGVAPGSGASGTACYNNGAGVVGAAGADGLLLIEEYS
jgi:hypothetical protein